MTIKNDAYVLGNSLTDTNNFLLDTDGAGALRIRRKSDGSGGLVMSIDSGGIPRDKDGLDMRPMGVGQTWQDVTGSRVSGTTYTNTTGRPIMVSLYGQSSAGSQSQTITVNGIQVANSSMSTGAAQTHGGASAVVPAGATYSCTLGFGTSNVWRELR